MDLNWSLDHLSFRETTTLRAHHWALTTDNISHTETKGTTTSKTTPGQGVGSYAIRLSLPAKYGENRAQEEGYWNMPQWANKKENERNQQYEIGWPEDHVASLLSLYAYVLGWYTPLSRAIIRRSNVSERHSRFMKSRSGCTFCWSEVEGRCQHRSNGRHPIRVRLQS